jgi:glutathione S-transferase
MSDLPILYSFRRCPYAMRARMALAAAGTGVMLREVLLKDKPAELLVASPKATVPVLVLSDGRVIEESLDVMRWALEHSDPLSWLDDASLDSDWISECDGDFKHWLDRYKYAERYPEHTAEDYRKNAEGFIQKLEDQLSVSVWVGGDRSQRLSMWRCFRLFGSLQASTPHGGSKRPTPTPSNGWKTG